MKKKFIISLGVVLAIVIAVLWLFWGSDTWNVQISGVTGDGRNIQYRIETVYSNTFETMIFRNEDAGFAPPYFKFNSADLQSLASRITRECPQEPVTIHGYGMRISFLDMFPNVISIDAPEHCIDAPSKAGSTAGTQE
ncbi:DUF1523 family protein [Rhabdochromatium marinum]|uniref:DUF1523 family protein n=1 Tax=Rhabdochromatium marinum TaxID=48729 RepID=UPI001903EB1B|nr:DUF1523 family protein [Rhabdochromatium marinum]MBK1649209.1 hypothetical protein [Rhabdochromatium marinum]